MISADFARGELADAVGVYVRVIWTYGGFASDASFYTAHAALADGKGEPDGPLQRVDVGKFKDLISQPNWRVRIPLALGASRIRGKKVGADWDALLPCIRALTEDADAGESGDGAALAQFLLGFTMRDRGVKLDGADGPTRAEVYADGLPFVEGERLHVNTADLHSSLVLVRTPMPSPKMLAILRGPLGFEREPNGRSARDEDGRVVNRRYWSAAVADLERVLSGEDDAEQAPRLRVVKGEAEVEP